MRWWNDEHMGIYAPSTHTGGLSEDGMRWWSDEHMGITHPIYVHLISCFS